ncbi:MAG TPA: hypothetical protein VHG28_06240 [Longimicrobiaceae bacterium]|nr:hypothetical protein [Longimicrobiaceae bacterium]
MQVVGQPREEEGALAVAGVVQRVRLDQSNTFPTMKFMETSCPILTWCPFLAWMAILLPPIITNFLLIVFVGKFWRWARDAKKIELPDNPTRIAEHNEMIYKDFEFFVKVFLALVAGFGYILFKESGDTTKTLVAAAGLAGIGMTTMVALVISVAAHQASKIRRWDKVDLSEVRYWQEPWMIAAMVLLADGLWVVAFALFGD